MSLKKMRKFVTILLFSISLIVTNLFAAPTHANNGGAKALWVWDFYEAAANSDKITQLLQFLKENNFNMIFIGTKNTLPDQPSTYVDLIQRAHAEGIQVFALVGRANWALEGYHRDALTELRQVLSFNKKYPMSTFDGIQFDIEPHTLPEYKTKRGSVCYQFIQVLKKIALEIDASGEPLEFNAAIPWWYGAGDNPVMVETGGERKVLSFFVLDYVDSASIMSYRDTADKQIRSTQSVADYAAKLGKKIYVGTETKAPDGGIIPEEITYFNKGLEYLNQQMDIIMGHYSGHPGFGGIALHNYTSYKQMLLNNISSN